MSPYSFEEQYFQSKQRLALVRYSLSLQLRGIYHIEQPDVTKQWLKTSYMVCCGNGLNL